MRRYSYLNPLKKAAPPLTDFETFDIEAQPGTWDKFNFLGHYDGREFQTFNSVPKYVDWLMATGGKTRKVYAHFLDYDFAFIMDELSKRKDITTRVSLANSLLLSASLIKGDKEVQFLNSYSLLQYSLEELMMTFLGKHKTPLDELEKRNYDDCVDLHKILSMFTQTVGTSGMTLSQMTLQFYRHKYQRAPIYNNWELDRLVRQSYFGGRVEVFNFNLDPDAKAYLYDINSMYPYVMREFPYPVGKMAKVYSHEPGSLGICKVRIENEGMLPLACERIDQKTMFLNAKKRIWITTFEYEKLKEMGASVEFEVGFETGKTAHIFKEYIDELYGRRMLAKAEGNKVMDVTNKLLMNSLYGKFGQRTEKTTYMINADAEEGAADMTPISDDRVFGFFSENKRNAFVVPMIASLTTAYARERLHSYLGKLDYETVLYCDTDCVYTTEKKLEDSKQLGMMKLEAEAQPFYVINPKFYIAGKMRLKAKGVPKQDMNMGSFYSYLCGGQITAKRGLVKFRSAIRGYARGENLIRVKEIKRSMKSVYDKRRMGSIETKPYHVRTKPELYTMMNRKPYKEFLRQVKPLIAELRAEQK